MMKKTAFAAILFALALVAAPAVQATTVTEVQAMIAALKAKTTTVVITGKNAETKDRPNLLAKLDDASLKLDRAKFCNAIMKVNDYKALVNTIIAAGQINQDPAAGTTAQELLADADAIIAAINELQVQSTGAACTF